MPFSNSKIIALMAALAICGPDLALAQTDPSDQDEQDSADADRSFDDPGGEAASTTPSRSKSSSTAPAPSSTASVVSSIEATTKYCRQVQPAAYIIDCLAERLGELETQLKGQAGFEEVRAVLETTSKDLNDIARQNRSSTLSAASFTTSDQAITSRRLVPVEDAKLESAVNQALAVIDQAETLLLRSAEESADRAIQFQRISAALGSNKVLLRSL